MTYLVPKTGQIILRVFDGINDQAPPTGPVFNQTKD